MAGFTGTAGLVTSGILRTILAGGTGLVYSVGMAENIVVVMNSGGIASTNCYLVGDPRTGEAVLFDAPNDTTGPLLDEVDKRGWKLIGLWLTHGHFDHVADHAAVTKRFPDAKVLIHRLDEPKLRGEVPPPFPLPISIPARSADGYVEDGDRLKIGQLEVEVIHTPGHSPGHVMYSIAEQGVLVGGDLIIMGAVGRTDLPDSDHSALLASIVRVMKTLPGTTRLLPGHGRVSTLDEERAGNDWVRAAVFEAEKGK
jgi:hydroxyacylglutathione hydrolase